MEISINQSICRRAVFEGILILSSFLFLSSCQRTLADLSFDSDKTDFEDVMVHSSNLPLFSDLSAFNLIPVTKSGRMEDDTLLCLKDLLDHGREENLTVNKRLVTAIPFLPEYCSGNVSITNEAPDYLPLDSLSRTRLFLVRTYDTEMDTLHYMVATMIPDMECQERMESGELSFMDKSQFSGLILYSNLDGTFLESLYVPYDAPAAFAVPVTSDEEADTNKCTVSLYISTGAYQTQTKAIKKVMPPSDMIRMRAEFDEPAPSEDSSGTGGPSAGGKNGNNITYAGINGNGTIYGIIDSGNWNSGVICTPDVYSYSSQSWYQVYSIYYSYSNYSGGSYIVNDSEGNYNYSNIHHSGRPSVDPVYFTVTLNARGKGSVYGSGQIRSGSTTTISAVADKGHRFSIWEGTISAMDCPKDNPSRITVTENVNLTGVFLEDKVDMFNVAGEKKYVEQFLQELNNHSNNIPLVRNLLSWMTEHQNRLKIIMIQDEVRYKNELVSGLLDPQKDKTYIIRLERSDASCNNGVNSIAAAYEEFLHFIQYCEEGIYWTSGDKELEAKVLLSILDKEYQIESKFKEEDQNIFNNYYQNPSDQTYDSAVSALRGMTPSYKDCNFTSGRNHYERLKHIKNLLAR